LTSKIAFKSRINLFLQWIPFTWNTFFLVILFFVSKHFLYLPINKENASNALLPLIRMMAYFVALLFISVIVLSILSTIFSCLYYLWLRKNKKSLLEINFYSVNKNNQKKQFLEVILPNVIKPLLGYVKARLVYDDQKLSEPFGLFSAHYKKNSLKRLAITGNNRLELPDIKEYQIKYSILFFEDLFQIISIPIHQKLMGTFYKTPEVFDANIEDVSPKQAETLDIRIDQLKKVEGDLWNYKTFESGDDVRRIVWKVFAKNRDLVVRMPEQMEPYASNLNLYASFYTSINPTIIGTDYFAEMLNYYKKNLWSIFSELLKKELKIKYLPDQEFHLPDNLNESEIVERIISNSVWQQDFRVNNYFSSKKGSVLVISSLSDIKDLQQIVQEADKTIQIIYIPLSKIFHQYLALHWIKSLFFIAAPDRLSKLRRNWIFSPLRRQILKNEKEIEALLK
jgi:hypothetical protein